MLKVGRLTYMLKTKDKNRNTKCTRNPNFDTLYLTHMLAVNMELVLLTCSKVLSTFNLVNYCKQTSYQIVASFHTDH